MEYAAMPSGRLQGIFTPNLVPYGPNGEINETELRRYVEWLIDKGVHGLYPNGSTGEFTRFTTDERRRIVAIIADQNRGRVPILAGAAEANVKETLAACEYYASLGVRAVAIVAPFYYKLSPASVYAYFREIGRNTPVDVTLYNIPMFASPIDVPTVRRLSEECERIVAIKDSSGDIPHMIRMMQAVRPNRPDFSFLTGWDAALMPMLLVGCDGGTNASSGVVPEMTRKLYDLTVGWAEPTTPRSNLSSSVGTAHPTLLDEARRLQYDLVTLFDTMIYSAEFPDGFRAAVELRGFRMGRGRQPLSDEQKTDLATLSNTLQCLLAAHGFTDEPIGGCPTDGEESVDPAEVGRIVQDVVAELRRRGMI
jgi:dihydrodipicolinate synthase/N-acetylneuraminate lyase